MATTQTIRMDIEGLPRVKRLLVQLPQKVQKRVLVKATRAGAAPITKAVKNLAPRVTGILRRSIISKFTTYPSGVVVGVTGQRLGDASQLSIRKIRKGRGGISGRGKIVPLHLVEEGTQPHRIPTEGNLPVPMKLRSGTSGWHYVSVVNHPGSRPQNFMKRAAQIAAPQAVSGFTRKLEQEVDIEINRIQ